MIASSTKTASVTPVSAMSGVRALFPSSASRSSDFAASTGCSTEWTISLAFSWSCTMGIGYPDGRLVHQGSRAPNAPPADSAPYQGRRMGAASLAGGRRLPLSRPRPAACDLARSAHQGHVPSRRPVPPRQRRLPRTRHGTSSATVGPAVVHAVIQGQEKCLHAGEFCRHSLDRVYRRYGFRCIRYDRGCSGTGSRARGSRERLPRSSAGSPIRKGEEMAEIKGKGFESPDEVRPFKDGKGQVELVDLNGHMIGRGTFEPGWRWSEHVKPLSGTDSCQVEHI